MTGRVTEIFLWEALGMTQGIAQRVVARFREAKKSPWDPALGKNLKWQDGGRGKAWARFTTNDNRRYTHKYQITQMGTGEWAVRLETPDGLKTVDAARSPNRAKQLAQEHMEKLVRSEKSAGPG